MKMEIKTGKQIHNFFESSLSPDSFSKPPIEFYQNQKWIVIDDLFNFIKQYECSLGDLPKELSDLKKALSETTEQSS